MIGCIQNILKKLLGGYYPGSMGAALPRETHCPTDGGSSQSYEKQTPESPAKRIKQKIYLQGTAR
jgi:hypothetical protein